MCSKKFYFQVDCLELQCLKFTLIIEIMFYIIVRTFTIYLVQLFSPEPYESKLQKDPRMNKEDEGRENGRGEAYLPLW